MKYRIWLIAFNIFLWGCSNNNQPNSIATETSPYSNNQFSKYWSQGLAELNSYELVQSRYGEPRKGEAVLVFVTERFSKSKQVKLDNQEQSKKDALPVLKLNFVKKFITGIYPYSMMMSSFTSLNGNTSVIKVSTTSQEWCGHTFTQLNNNGNGYDVALYSYFESEGDKKTKLAKDIILEDGIWSTIRINPTTLAVGSVNILPGTLYQRLTHQAFSPVKANCLLDSVSNNPYAFISDSIIYRYTIKYTEQQHTLAIDFLSHFPYTILGWKETYPDIIDNKLRQTTAILSKTLMLDYWNHNSTADSIYLDSLLLNK